MTIRSGLKKVGRLLMLALIIGGLHKGPTAAAISLDEQCDLERERVDLALVLRQSDLLAREFDGARSLLSSIYDGWPPAIRRTVAHRLEAALEGMAMNSTLMAANSNPARPVVLHVVAPPHSLRGLAVPDSRKGADNADTVYALAPVNGNYRYVIDGDWGDRPPSDFNISAIVDDLSHTQLAVLGKRDIFVAPDGTFSILVERGSFDDEITHQAKNRLVLPATARALFFRDTLSDWTEERPTALTIRRIDDAPAFAPESEDMLAHRAAMAFRDEVRIWSSIQETVFSPDLINRFPPNILAMGANGTLLNQARADTFYHLSNDEALIVLLHPADAEYASIGLTDAFAVTIDPANVRSSLNLAEAVRGPDGSITAIISARDPGFANWIDTGAVGAGLVTVRWQGLGEAETALHASMKRVSWRDAKSMKEAPGFRVSKEERDAKSKQRRKSYALRFARCGDER